MTARRARCAGLPNCGGMQLQGRPDQKRRDARGESKQQIPHTARRQRERVPFVTQGKRDDKFGSMDRFSDAGRGGFGGRRWGGGAETGQPM